MMAGHERPRCGVWARRKSSISPPPHTPHADPAPRTHFFSTAVLIRPDRRSNERSTLGCSQVVRQRFLVPCTVGSNPTTPATQPEKLQQNPGPNSRGCEPAALRCAWILCVWGIHLPAHGARPEVIAVSVQNSHPCQPCWRQPGRGFSCCWACLSEAVDLCRNHDGTCQNHPCQRYC